MFWHCWTAEACMEMEVEYLRMFACENLNLLGAQGRGRIFEGCCFQPTFLIFF